MDCLEAPVAQRGFHDDKVRYGDKVSFLGIIASSQHSADCHSSSHNCASTCGGQEGPVNGVAYDPRYAHALDTGVGSNLVIGYEIVDAYCHDPRCRYCIYRGVIYYGLAYRAGPNGTIMTGRGSGHPTHVHRSFLPGTTFDTRPFYMGLTPEEDLDVMQADTKNYLDRHFLAGAVQTEKAKVEVLQAEWRTRTLLREAGVIADKDDPDGSKLKASIDGLTVGVARLEKRLTEIGGPPEP